MYLRTTNVKKSNGEVAGYVQLCRNEYDQSNKRSRVKVLHSFGRSESLDIESLKRLVKSISRFLEPDEAQMMLAKIQGIESFDFASSHQLGETWVLDGLWKKLGIDKTLKSIMQRRNFKSPVERTIFAMVANRAIDPCSKLGMEHWVSEVVHVDGLPQVESQQLYRAMDFLLEASEEIQKDVFFSVANLFNLQVDLIFFDTTSTYFEVEEKEDDGFRRRGYSKDKRPDLAQVVIGLAMTREGIPVRCWSWPGNTSDSSIVEEVKRDLNAWTLNRVIFVGDAGFNNEDNRRCLRGAGGHYIIGEKMRFGTGMKRPAALARGGKYRAIDDNLECKEVIVDADSVKSRRFIVVRNKKEAERDRLKRQDIVAEVERRLADLEQESGASHRKKACELRSHRTYGRYIRQTKNGILRLNKRKIRDEAALDGKFLISTSDEKLSNQEIVQFYKQLWRIEQLNRHLKHVVNIRPVYHRLEDRIRAHVILCWLALLLLRIAELETGETWFQLSKKLFGLHLGKFKTADGEFWQSTSANPIQKAIFNKIGIKSPPDLFKIST